MRETPSGAPARKGTSSGRRGPDVAGEFTAEVIRAIRKEHPDERATAVEAALAGQAPRLYNVDDVSRYYALCERAWLRWTRLALDYITTHRLQQASVGHFNPRHVRNAQEAGEAEVRCGLHWRLVDLAADACDDQGWAWRLEAARQVHASAQKVLKLGASIDALDPPTVYELYPGITSAADALVTAISAGFVVEAVAEVRATVQAMNRGGS
jgi:hypothetical protein